MAQWFWSPELREFHPEPALADSIPVTDFLRVKLLDAQRAGKDIPCDERGTPLDILALSTLVGMRNAVLDELREQRAGLLNALTGVGLDAQIANDAALLAQVATARSFLKNITTDPAVLAVQPGNGPGQGAEYMRQVVLQKYLMFAAQASPAVRNAFREVA